MIFGFILRSDTISSTPKHSTRGYFTIEILADGTIRDYQEPGPDPPKSDFDFYLFHGWMMWSAWGLLGFT